MDASRQKRSRPSLMTRISSALLLVSCILAPAQLLVHAGTKDIVVTEREFDHGPAEFSFFADSPVVLYRDLGRNVFRSTDEGKNWDRVKEVPEDTVTDMVLHPFDNNIAFILTKSRTHWRTSDQGSTWRKFETELPPIEESYVMSFHATRVGWILIAVTSCNDRGDCHDETYYTRDGFDSPPKKLLSYTSKCEWAVSSSNFDEAPVELIHCLQNKVGAEGLASLDEIQMVKSTDFFETNDVVVFGNLDRSAIVNFVTKETFMLAAEKHITTGDMSLYVSEDAKTWAKAHFPQGRENSYTILESTPYSLIVDVQASPNDPYGALMTSNSNGTYFVRSRPYTNRNDRDTVDFEKVQNIDGVYIVNLLDNHESAPRDPAEKHLRTQITFDAGANWQYVLPPETKGDGKRQPCTPNTDGTCSLHLHSVTSAKVSAPVFSSKAAPGVIMGVGSVGPYLLPWEACDTYLSEDGGLTWKFALEHPHKYEFGDMGAIIVAVRDDNVPVGYFQYTADRGQSWHQVELPENIRPAALVSDPKSTSQKFLLFARNGGGVKVTQYHLDLTKVFGRKCERRDDHVDSSDFEKWYARNIRNNPDCLMGAQTWYWRRKANAECMVQESFKEPSKTEVICECTDEDFECDYNYVLKDGVCVLEGKEIMRDGTCTKEGDTYLGSSGYRKVPGNKCTNGLKKDEAKTKQCVLEEAPKDIKYQLTKFNSPMLTGFQYFIKSSVIMFMSEAREVWRSADDGLTWTKVLPEVGRFAGLYLHDENNQQVYLFTASDIYVSHNRGESFDSHALPAPPNQFAFNLIDFHPDSDKKDWLLYLGQKEGECFTRLYRTTDAGRNWAQVDTWVDKAVYARHQLLDMPRHGIYSMSWKLKSQPANVCQDELYSSEANPLQMVYMLDTDTQRLSNFDHVVQFYVVDRFLAVAVESNGDFILQVSIDGHSFTPAQFPPKMRVDKKGFTVLQSTTGSLVVDVARSNVPDREHGRLFKSNSDGTYFSRQLDDTNRNANQLVDWEKIGGIDGVILVNQVTNRLTLAKDGDKHIRSLISFNDGGSWNPIRAPAGSDCNEDECHLHLHSVTDSTGPGAVFSASSAVGLVMGVGNVGKILMPLKFCQTYLSRDAGKTWTKVSDTRNLYEFGDEGGVIVRVDPSAPTQEAFFSYDFGATWDKAEFATSPVEVSTVTTESTSRTSKITITGTYVSGDRQPIISTLDFSARRACVMKKNDPEKNDFEKWSPFDGEDDRCILGKDISYWRRKPDRTCRVNDDDGVPDMEVANCKCTAKDYECAIGYFRDEAGECQPEGHDPDKPAKCTGTYLGSSGLKKIQASSCEGGEDLESKKVERQCNAMKEVESKMSAFENRFDRESDTFFYFPDSDVAMLKIEDQVFLSDNDGKDWNEITLKIEGAITGLQRHPYSKERAVIGTSGQEQYLTQDRGVNWDALDLPLQSAATNLLLNPWYFHPTQPEWMIFIGESGCSYERDASCHSVAYYSQDSGKSWHQLAEWVRSCSWARDPKFTQVNEEGIYCEQYADRSGSQRNAVDRPVRFVYSDDYMRSPRILFDQIVGYATYSNYLIAAEYIPSRRQLQVSVTTDGLNFKPARYPHGYDIVNPAYTVLDSTTMSVFMAITTIDRPGSKVGRLFTSDSNGTYFSLSNKYVSEGNGGNVDFEKMQGIDGVALLNEVINPNEASQGKKKQLRSAITFDNGQSWNPLKAPQVDSGGKPYEACKSEECTLNLHNYLDRKHVEDLFSSSSIPGMVIGVGNVGQTLGAYEDGNTFLTRDGGFSWTEILSGPYQYDFGDQGSIILLAKDNDAPTDWVMYSLDHGETFKEFTFTTEKVIVKDIMAKPNGIGKSFILFAHPPSGSSRGNRQLLFQIDFEGLDYPKCVLNLKDEAHDDFERWSLGDLRGTADTCMFGRKVEYFRRIAKTQCFVGELEVNPREITQACQCTEKDFECDFNYELDEKTGQCVLIEGATPVTVNEKEVCANLPPDQNFYYDSIGYRKMAFSSCTGDHERFGTKKYCPGRGGLGFFSWVGILLGSGVAAYGVVWGLTHFKGRMGRGSFISLGNDVYDQMHLPRSSSLPTMNMPRSFSRSWGRFHVPDMVYQTWDKVSSTAGALVPQRVRGFFSRGSGYRYQNLSQEPGEVIMDDYFDHYLDDDDEDHASATVLGDVGLRDGLEDAQERYRDESDDEGDDGDEDLDAMV